MSLKLNTASGGSITLQEADTASNLTLTVPATTGNILVSTSQLVGNGTTTNDNASAGQVGEYIESWSGYFTNTTTTVNGTSISLTAGDWDVFVATSSGGASATCTGASIGINTTSATLGTQSQDFINFSGDTINGNIGGSYSKRISLSATTTVYGVTKVAAGTATFTSVQLSARRAR
jgi:hypothetical protein